MAQENGITRERTVKGGRGLPRFEALRHLLQLARECIYGITPTLELWLLSLPLVVEYRQRNYGCRLSVDDSRFKQDGSVFEMNLESVSERPSLLINYSACAANHQ